MNDKTTLDRIRQRINPYSSTPYLDSLVLLSHILERSRSWILAHPNALLSSSQQEKIHMALKKLEHGVPLPYVLGSWEFYQLSFKVTPDVLIPRPETELLVDYAREWLGSHPTRRSCADIGTGSGCIPISIAHHTPDSHFTAGDLSRESLRIAQINAAKHKVDENISFYQGHLMQALGGTFDLITANLPYIPRSKLVSLDVYGREPTRALDGGREGLKYISSLLHSAPRKLKKGGLTLIEIDESQGKEVYLLGKKYFPQAKVSVSQDLSGKDRLLIIQTREP